MDITSKKLPGAIIKWSVIVGGVILFHEMIFAGLFTSLEGVFLLVECLEDLENFLGW